MCTSMRKKNGIQSISLNHVIVPKFLKVCPLKDTEKLMHYMTKLLSDIYDRCNVALCEPANLEVALHDSK